MKRFRFGQLEGDSMRITMPKLLTHSANRIAANPISSLGTDTIVPNYAGLASAIRLSIAETFSDPFVYGPMLPETAVDRIVAGIIDRVSECRESKEGA